MEERRLNIGITCYPLIGGSGILATALGSELALRGHRVHFFSSALPVRLDLTQPGISFHKVIVNESQSDIPNITGEVNEHRDQRAELYHGD